MTQEDKELLLQDLSARLPYSVKIAVNDRVETLQGISVLDNVAEYGSCLSSDIEEVKPYLFPLSSMNLDQRIEYSRTLVIFDESHCSQTPETYDWLNKNHFDYRGLIEKGLALDATGKNIYLDIKQEDKDLLLKDLEWFDMETKECHCYSCELFDTKNNICKCIDLCKNPKSTYKGFYVK